MREKTREKWHFDVLVVESENCTEKEKHSSQADGHLVGSTVLVSCRMRWLNRGAVVLTSASSHGRHVLCRLLSGGRLAGSGSFCGGGSCRLGGSRLGRR